MYLKSKRNPYLSKVAGVFDPIFERRNGLSEAKRFLTKLDPQAEKFNFRIIGDNYSGNISGSIDSNYKYLQQKNSEGCGIFVTINETDGIGLKKDNIVRVRAIFLDFDDNSRDIVSAINSMPIEPSIIVCTSSRKFHCYFLVKDCPLDEFTNIQKFFNHKFNADPSVNDLPRIMRLPGFYHNKGNPFYSHIVGES